MEDYPRFFELLFLEMPMVGIFGYTVWKAHQLCKGSIVMITSTYEARITSLLDRQEKALKLQRDAAREREVDLLKLLNAVILKPHKMN